MNLCWSGRGPQHGTTKPASRGLAFWNAQVHFLVHSNPVSGRLIFLGPDFENNACRYRFLSNFDRLCPHSINLVQSEAGSLRWCPVVGIFTNFCMANKIQERLVSQKMANPDLGQKRGRLAPHAGTSPETLPSGSCTNANPACRTDDGHRISSRLGRLKYRCDLKPDGDPTELGLQLNPEKTRQPPARES